jgi:diaminopimelate decarboxylase
LNNFPFIDGILHTESVAVTDLMAQYGSPLYIYSRSEIESNWQKYEEAFSDHRHLICFAVKSNSNLAVLNILAKLGAGFDVVSIGELHRVIEAGGDSSKCVFSGVGKSVEEIKEALGIGIYCFNIESESELDRIITVAESIGVVAPISVRVNPDVDAKTHPYISTGLKENKFGVDIESALSLYRKAENSKSIKVCGVDYHIGSQITEVSPFMDALDKVFELISQLSSEGIEIEHLDIGGGLGINYDNTQTINISDYIRDVKSKAGDLEILIEPGRSVVGSAGIFVTKVEYLKHNLEKSFAIVDGAMNDLLRPSLYSAYHKAVIVQKSENGQSGIWDLVGPICETGDFLAKDRDLTIAEGDYVAFMSAGAYCFSMSSNYNTRPRVAEVMVWRDNHTIIRARETIKELYRNEKVIDG